jgi:plastocyanin
MKPTRIVPTLMGLAMALPTFVQASDDVLYAPARSIADQRISVRPWGSGTIAETDEFAPPGAGVTSIRISTRNLFQGGELDFGKPLDLSTDFNDKGNCLQLTYRLADNSVMGGRGGGKAGGGFGGPPGIGAPAGGGATGGNRRGPAGGGKAGGGFGGPPGIGGAAGGRGQGFPGLPGGGRPGGGRAGGPPAGLGGAGQGFPGGGQGFPGMPGGLGRGTNNAPKELQMLRLVVTTTDGLRSEAYVPAAPRPRGDEWPDVGVPLQAINGFARTNKVVQSVAISGDTTTTLYVGGLRIVNDPTPVTGDILVYGETAQSLNLAIGDEVEFTGAGYAGASVLKYEWNFDDKAGKEPDAIGQTVKRKFRKPGNYTITLTITDVFGLKKPYTTTIPAVVNP